MVVDMQVDMVKDFWRDIFSLVEDMDVYMITDKGVDMVKEVGGAWWDNWWGIFWDGGGHGGLMWYWTWRWTW